MEAILGKGEKSTPISLTNHSYFNLDGHDSSEGISEHVLSMKADRFTVNDGQAIPTRECLGVEKFGFLNFKKPKRIHEALMEQGV